jgi:uncharacterized surface protein with fasciclin (FAS1) repeats
MKISLLSTALVAAFALAGCQQSAPADDAMATSTDDMASADAMSTSDGMAPADGMSADGMMSTGNPMVGGSLMMADRDIIDNAVNSADHTTLVAAVKAAGLVDTLKGPGPFTVFAPTNAAFDALPDGTVDTLLKPEMKGDLTKVLTYHVVPGNLDAAALAAQIQAGNGEAMLATVQGESLTAKAGGPGGITLTDAKGNVANVTIADVRQSNGVIHVVDTVLMP